MKIKFKSKKTILASLLLLIPTAFQCIAEEKPLSSTILYFNDAHVIYPVVDNLGERGGVARLKTVVDQIKEEKPDSKLVFGGDLAGGLLFGAVYHGFPMVEAMNLIPVDYANFGQHDFDFGLKNTLQLVEKSKFQWISTNLKYKGGELPGTKPYVITEIGGLKIAFLGLIDALNTSTPDKNLSQLNLDTAVKSTLPEIIDKKPDFIIAITQTDFDINQKILKDNPEIGAVLTEENSETVTVIKYVGNKPVISPCGNIGSLARLDISKSKGEIRADVSVYPIDKSVKSNPELFKLEEKYRTKLNSELDQKISNLECPLDAGFNTDSKARFKETNIGDLLADSYRAYYKSDIAFMNGGGIRTNTPKGPFTMKKALAIIPFNNTICEYKCTGKAIMEALEHGVSGVENLKGSFLQVSGMKYSYNPKAKVGNRITSVTINGQPIILDKEYTVAMPSFIFKGGDGFTMFSKSKVLVPEQDAQKDINVFIDYCKKLKDIDYKTDGRIEITK